MYRSEFARQTVVNSIRPAPGIVPVARRLRRAVVVYQRKLAQRRGGAEWQVTSWVQVYVSNVVIS